MDRIQKLMVHTYIKDTIGYDVFNKVPMENKDEVIDFCKIIWSYIKIDKILSNEREVLGKHEQKEKKCTCKDYVYLDNCYTSEDDCEKCKYFK